MNKFNHYAKMANILNQYDFNNIYIKRIDKPTKTKSFNGEVNYYNCYWRFFMKKNDMPIPYCKFQQWERLASHLNVSVAFLELLLKK